MLDEQKNYDLNILELLKKDIEQADLDFRHSKKRFNKKLW
ncbi:Uncharacterised protein, partial [Metamycoplasma alkalescens]